MRWVLRMLLPVFSTEVLDKERTGLKILQVIRSVDPRGGGPIEGMIQQGEEMRAAGHDVETLTLDAPASPSDERLSDNNIHFLGPAFLGYGYSHRLAPWLRQHGPGYDVILVHGMWQYHGYCVARVARQLGLPYVIFLHGMLDPWFAREYPLKHLKKWLYWPWAEYRVLRDARFVLFTTAEELRLARESFWLYKVRERLVGYGIKARQLPIGSAREAYLSAYPALRGKRILLYLSRIHPKKGCDMLIESFAQLAAQYPDTHLVMAGPDGVGWQAKLKARVAQLGLSGRISFPGMLTGEVKWGAYDAADVFVLPSHQENFGIVVAEALASALPVLTTHQVNIWREVAESRAGFVRPDTPEGTTQLLHDWLDLTAEEQDAMRQRALRCFEAHFEIRKVVGQLLSALADAAWARPGMHSFSGTGLAGQ